MNKTDNKSAINRVWDKVKNMMPDISLQKALITLAFAGCVQSSSAKTVIGAIKGYDGNATLIATKEGDMLIESASLVRAGTIEGNKKGGDLIAKVDFDENTSQVRGGYVFNSRVRLSSGISDARIDIEDVIDDVNIFLGNVRNGNIGRIIKNVGDAVEQYSPETFRGGIVRVKGRAEDGKIYWMKYHKVDCTGNLKPEFYKNQTSTYSDSYSQSSYSAQSSYAQSSNSGYNANRTRFQSRYRQ